MYQHFLSPDTQVTNVSFSKHFAHVLNEWLPNICDHQKVKSSMTRPPDPDFAFDSRFYPGYSSSSLSLLLLSSLSSRKDITNTFFKVMSFSLIMNLISFGKCGLREISFHHQESLNREVEKERKLIAMRKKWKSNIMSKHKIH